ncbi:MAG: peptidylprolyl isomerase [Acetobacteraceae bacterium]|jgi:cyclophilin family peptidyl-prolyl cis-trans isomerase
MHRRLMLAAGLGALASPALAQANDPENTLFLELKDGRVTIRLLPELAPRHVERIKVLARRGFYDNTPFHRVIAGFMAQGGDRTGTGLQGSDLPNLRSEFSPPSRASFLRGVCGMARTQQDPHSANSQFFIMLAANTGLDGQYTIWGQVTAGMEAVDKIKRGDPANNGMVRDPDKLRTMRVAADIR